MTIVFHVYTVINRTDMTANIKSFQYKLIMTVLIFASGQLRGSATPEISYRRVYTRITVFAAAYVLIYPQGSLWVAS